MGANLQYSDFFFILVYADDKVLHGLYEKQTDFRNLSYKSGSLFYPQRESSFPIHIEIFVCIYSFFYFYFSINCLSEHLCAYLHMHAFVFLLFS